MLGLIAKYINIICTFTYIKNVLLEIVHYNKISIYDDLTIKLFPPVLIILKGAEAS